MRSRRALALVVTGLAVAAAFAACGRKTFIRPPELAAPEPIEGLAGANAADGIQLVWPRPKVYADGTRMTDLGSFEIQRSDAESSFVPVGTVEVTDRERLQQERRYRWTDTDTVVGQSYAYRVLSETTDGYRSVPSNIVVIERAIPTPGPTKTPAK